MRVFLVGVYWVIFAIYSLPLYPIAYLIGKKDEKKQVAFSQAIVRHAFRVMLLISGVKLECKGIEKLPKDQAYMYAANHRSNVDILVGYRTVPTLTGFVSKDSLKKVPCVSTWMKYLKCMFLDRKDLKKGMQVILQGISQLKEGYSVFIMPEGTRNHNEEMLPFHEGSFKLATKSGCSIVPVAMKNTDKVVGHHFAWLRPIKVTIVYGTPIDPNSLTPEEKKHIGAYTQNVIKEMLENID